MAVHIEDKYFRIILLCPFFPACAGLSRLPSRPPASACPIQSGAPSPAACCRRTAPAGRRSAAAARRCARPPPQNVKVSDLLHAAHGLFRFQSVYRCLDRGVGRPVLFRKSFLNFPDGSLPRVHSASMICSSSFVSFGKVIWNSFTMFVCQSTTHVCFVKKKYLTLVKRKPDLSSIICGEPGVRTRGPRYARFSRIGVRARLAWRAVCFRCRMNSAVRDSVKRVWSAATVLLGRGWSVDGRQRWPVIELNAQRDLFACVKCRLGHGIRKNRHAVERCFGGDLQVFFQPVRLAASRGGNACMYRGASTPGAALSLYFLPSGVSTSALIS